MTLVAGLGDVDSAAPSWSMWDMSRIVKGSPDLTAAFDEGSTGLHHRLRDLAESGNPSAEDFWKLFGSFIDRFGARGPNEWELRSRTWGIDLDVPLAAIDRMRFAPDDDSPQVRTELRVVEREAATDFVREVIAGDAQAAGTFEVGLRCAHLYNAGRERTKTNNIKLVHEQRLALRELGRRAVERGHLQSIEQIFMLVDLELDDFVERPADFTSSREEARDLIPEALGSRAAVRHPWRTAADLQVAAPRRGERCRSRGRRRGAHRHPWLSGRGSGASACRARSLRSPRARTG